jgi:hypothetical protein
VAVTGEAIVAAAVFTAIRDMGSRAVVFTAVAASMAVAATAAGIGSTLGVC